MTDATDPPTIDSLADPATLTDHDGVVVSEQRREFPREHYEGLAERYAQLDGVVQVVVRRADGAVLLQRHDEGEQWHPPGGNVAEGQDWTDAARETIES